MHANPPVQLSPRSIDAHKGDFGRILLVGGSRGMSGAIAMSALASLRSGAGLVTAAVPDRCLESVAAFHPAIMTLPMEDTVHGAFATNAIAGITDRMAKSSVVGCGPGMTVGNGSVRIVERLIATRSLPRVIDADGLNCLAQLKNEREASGADGRDDQTDWGPLVLTPHPGELHRLTGVPASDPDAQIAAAIDLSVSTGAVVVVKGGPTTVVHGKSRWTNSTGNPGMATAGSGDVLTGVITSLLGQGLSPWDAARLGVWTHGLAGDLAAERHGPIGMTALEILDAIPLAMREATAPSRKSIT